MVTDAVEGSIQVGVSLTGADGHGANGSGLLGVLRFHADAPLPSSIDLRLSKAVVRSVAGVDDTLTTTQVVSLELHWKGDINQDGRLDLSDVFALVDILGTSPAGAEDELYDFDEDGSLGLGDVHTLMAHFPVSAKRSGWQEDAVLLPNRPLLLLTVSKPVQRGDRHPARSARSSVRRACRA